MSGGLWHVGTVLDTVTETSTGRSILMDVAGWPGNTAGQHADIRLTAEDGYQAVRSYSLASSGPGALVQIAVDRLESGEVSPYLVDELRPGDQIELRGPLGQFFIWKPETPIEPVQLIGGGSGIVPLMSMVRAHNEHGSTAPFRLLYSVRAPDDAFFRTELLAPLPHTEVHWLYTRQTPTGWARPPGRITATDIAAAGFSPAEDPSIYVCGPTGFVETVADALVALGHNAQRIKTERFGG